MPVRNQIAPEHWLTDDQFARQLGNPASSAVVRARWVQFAAALRSFCSELHVARGVDVLDAGCGDGINLVGLRDVLQGIGRPCRLMAIDTNPIRIKRARALERAADRIAYGSVTAMPFPTGSFDVVLCNHVLEHVLRPDDAVVEIARVLRPGGLAMIGVPNEGCVVLRLRNHLLQRSILRTTDHVNFFTRTSLTELLTGAGLVVREARTTGFLSLPHLRLTNLIASSGAGRALLRAGARLVPSQAADLIVLATRSNATR